MPSTPSPPEHLTTYYERIYGSHPKFIVRAPGRVDLIGAHVDYNDGYVLPAAIARNVWLAVGHASDTLTRIIAADLYEAVTLQLEEVESRHDVEGNPLPGWATYPAGVAWALRTEGLATPSINAVLTGDVPIGAGLSSSAAVEVAFGLAWRHLADWHLPRMRFAQLCRKAENDYVGVASGLMDQFASVFGQEGHGLFLDCRTLAWEALPMPPGTTLVVADTGTRRLLTEGGLNNRQQECAGALSLLQPHLPHITALRDVSRSDLERLEDYLPEPLRVRAWHVVTECERVLEAAEAMRRGAVESLGELMNASQVSSRDLYESSGLALDAMWEAANAQPACYGGRFVGAGFAGCLVFLVQADGADAFITRTSRSYTQATGESPDLYIAHASQGAEIIPLA